MADPGSEALCDLYRRASLVRRVEEAIVAFYGEQEMRCPTHLSIGQEGVAAGVCAALRDDDAAFSTHRCHGHYLAKGGGVKEMIAELYGKASGCCKGKGGSMHLVMPEKGMLGASAIVGGSTPIAAGAALAFKMRGSDSVAVAFGGDAAVEGGTFHESLNLASLWKLPVLFVIENNLYATHSPLRARQPASAPIHKRAEAYGVPGVLVDGTDAVAVLAAAREAVARARRGEGPTLIEATCYRWKEHVGPNEDFNMGYRTKAELDAWKARCPVAKLRESLVARGAAKAAELDAVDAEIQAAIDEAFRLAKAAPFPRPSELLEDVYA